MREFPSNNKKIVIKVSTQMITDGVAEIYRDKIKIFVGEVAELMKEHSSLISRLSNLEKERESDNIEIKKLKENLEEVKTEKSAVENERDFLARELERIAALYEELTGNQASQEDLRDLLGIYITLMEEIFSGKAHFKVLSIMHGEKAEWTRQELVKSTGVSELQLRKVLGELSRAGIIIYNEEHTTANLLKRIETLE